MPVLSESLQRQLREAFGSLPRAVTIVAFARPGCESCHETRQLIDELASISDGRIAVKHYDLDSAEARFYDIDKAPAVVVLGGESGRRDFGMRFFGAPAGYEFGTLIEDIQMASAGTSDLSPATAEALARVTEPLALQVFVTPTCPYCPRAVLLAHKIAMTNDLITAAAVDATEFPDLADRYEVRGVPRTVINDTIHIEGAVPEAMLLAQLMPLIGGTAPHVRRAS